ncbi:redoxin domain-containing protein [Puniceicoccus vermicola]|uniref:Redoxin domain-containing protein n=1 Tax=Puniceicoccus vermicola TaxID=388746 RepID=A0A7X1E4T9_9BACT|nr:redoxin domain-containing protein [Puniceicoccus vermicola]MBC2600952.1 redoxin domain-containing protein [Puniceicoccus vermicola]
MALSKGTKAPDFKLKYKTADGLTDVTLSDNFGKKNTVLLFFPFAFTSVCMSEMCSVRDTLNAFTELNASVYGISVDSPFTLEVMAKKENISFPLLSDFNKDVAKAYDVLYEDLLGLRGVAKRSAFVINKDGEITYSWSSDDPKNVPDFPELRAAISA